MVQEYRLTLPPSTLKPGTKHESEVDGIPDATLLLVNTGRGIHALSPRCTHYGASLVKGVLDAKSGRLRCPWHGACFAVASGDVEDAPALDPLARFEVVEREGALWVKGEEGAIKGGKRTLDIKCAVAEGAQEKEEGIVVVGGGAGAAAAVEALRGGGYQGPLTVVSLEGYRPIDRTRLSKVLLTDVEKLVWRSEEFYKEAGIDFVFDEVTGIDFGAKKVHTKTGKSFGYGKLILASGGRPRWLPLPGLKGDLKNVFVLRAVPDAKAIMEAAGSEGGKNVVVIGSSFIGMEVGNCLAGKKHNVSIIGMEKEPMERVMGTTLGKIFRSLVEKNGVKFYMGAMVDKATPSSSDSSKVGAVHLKDGTTLEADLVIEGVGIAPATEYLKNNKDVELLRDGSIQTDETFAVEGLEDVFAIGDIATFPYNGPGGSGALTRIEHWDVAQNSGRAVAAAINKSTKKSFIPIFWSALGSPLRYCGNTVGGYDDVLVLGNTDSDKVSFIAYYAKGEEVVAAASMGKDPLVMQVAQLMIHGKMPNKSELKKGVDILQIDLSEE